jgi:nucleoside-diphosphate-sugar epimerase
MMKNREFLKDKKIVVTGGAGFIGSHIVDLLVEIGAKVVVIDDFSTGKIDNIKHNLDKIELVQCSINDTEKLISVFNGSYGILHLAAIPSVPRSITDPILSHSVNSTGTLSVFVAANSARVNRVVYSSSSSVYGNTEILPNVETIRPSPLSPYAVQKLTTELYAKIFFDLYKIETIGLRYFNVFGPRQDPDSEYSAVIPKFIKLINENKNPNIYGDGTNTRDFTFVENVAEANINSLLVDSGFGDVYNIAGGRQVSLNDLVEKINLNFNKNLRPNFQNGKMGDIKYSFADISKAKKILYYNPNIDFDSGLKMTIDWFLDNV